MYERNAALKKSVLRGGWQYPQGFSLIEFTCVFALLTILFSLGSEIWLLQHKRAERTWMLDGLIQTILFARQAAVLMHQPVHLCPAQGIDACGENWAQGVIVFLPERAQEKIFSKTVLLHTPIWHKTAQVLWHGFLPGNILVFEADGLPHGHHGTFYWKISETQQEPLLTMNTAGRLRREDL